MKQHCQKETPDFLRETIGLCRELTDKPLLIRLNSGNDASENIGVFMEESYRYNNVSFIIKRNPRQESKIVQFWYLDFSEADSILADIYSKYMPAPCTPSCMLRSCLLSFKLMFTSITIYLQTC